jgi:hypothetical protein
MRRDQHGAGKHLDQNLMIDLEYPLKTGIPPKEPGTKPALFYWTAFIFPY